MQERLFLLFFFVFPGFVHAATCNFLPESPRPDWVGGSQGVQGEQYFSVGSSSARAEFSAMLDEAKRSALKALAETIQVSVKSGVTQQITEKSSSDRARVETVRQTLSETATNVSLRSVRYSEPWLDRSSCMVWVRASVTKATVEQSKNEQIQRSRIEEIRALIAGAQNNQSATGERLAAAKSAAEILSLTDFALIPDVSRPYFQGQVDELLKALEQGRSAQDEATQVIKSAGLAEEKARLEFDEGRRAALQREALAAYRGLLAKYPKGVPNGFRVSEVTLRLADLESERNNPCAARRYYMNLLDMDDSAAAGRARARLPGMKCSPAEQEQANWRQAFEGRTVKLVCAYRATNKISAWPKVCDSVANLIRPLGASVEVLDEVPGGQQFQQWVKDGKGLSAEANAVGIYVLADGNLNTQKGESGKDTQFSGNVATLMAESGRALYSDRFNGVTGWNPFGEQMTMDVLALNVVKRWQERFAQYLKTRQ